eukprot:COSAG01_NODE_6874_length_3460_cov_24.833978_2_plen_57_part_00
MWTTNRARLCCATQQVRCSASWYPEQLGMGHGEGWGVRRGGGGYCSPCQVPHYGTD